MQGNGEMFESQMSPTDGHIIGALDLQLMAPFWVFLETLGGWIEPWKAMPTPGSGCVARSLLPIPHLNSVCCTLLPSSRAPLTSFPARMDKLSETMSQSKSCHFFSGADCHNVAKVTITTDLATWGNPASCTAWHQSGLRA